MNQPSTKEVDEPLLCPICKKDLTPKAGAVFYCNKDLCPLWRIGFLTPEPEHDN